MLKRFLIVQGAVWSVIALAFAGAIAFGGPGTLPPLASVTNAVLKRDRSDLPSVQRFTARDGTPLAYRAYPAPSGHVAAVLIHGSVGSGVDMHEIGKALAAAGVSAYAPDLRGHGASGAHGDIAYIGQLEDDLADLLDELERQSDPAKGRGPATRVLIGHSSGGGLALRVAASPLGQRFVGAILLAPALGPDAPTARPAAGGWVSVGLPRIIAIAILERAHIHALGGLPVLAFAVAPSDAVTPVYSFRLTVNFAPHRPWTDDVAAASGPLIVIVGDKDQLFRADQYPVAFRASRDARVQILPGVDHMGVTGDATALAAVVTDTAKLTGDH